MSFLTEAEIIEDVLNKLSDEDRAYIKKDPQDLQSVWFRSSFARWVRNHYNLWDGDNPFTMKNYVSQMELYQPPGGFVMNCSGDDAKVDMNPKHPDNFSDHILDEVFRRVKDK